MGVSFRVLAYKDNKKTEIVQGQTTATLTFFTELAKMIKYDY
jgi:hypothetical protein